MYVWTFDDSGELSLATSIRPEDKTADQMTYQELLADPRYQARLNKAAEETTVAPKSKQSRRRSESENPEDEVQQAD